LSFRRSICSCRRRLLLLGILLKLSWSIETRYCLAGAARIYASSRTLSQDEIMRAGSPYLRSLHQIIRVEENIGSPLAIGSDHQLFVPVITARYDPQQWPRHIPGPCFQFRPVADWIGGNTNISAPTGWGDQVDRPNLQSPQRDMCLGMGTIDIRTKKEWLQTPVAT
jgi:hypothetical protein